MYHRIVLTAGISLLMNKRNDLEANFPNLFSLDQRKTNEYESFMEEVTDYFFQKFISEAPFDEQLCAEISMIAALKKQNKLHNNPVIQIFHTDTVTGIIAANIMKEVLETEFSAKVNLKKIIYVDVENRVAFTKSLGYFLSEVSEELSKGEPNSTCFAPIGGYKVFTSLGYLVGSFHQHPTAYLHERFSVLHEIPPVRIQVNDEFIERNHLFLRKMMKDGIVELESLSPTEKAIIREEPMFFTVEEELVELNPFGRFLCSQDKFAHYFQPNVSIDQTVFDWIKTKYSSNLPVVKDEINSFIIKHRDFPIENRSILFHESDFVPLKGKRLQCHLYKGGNYPVFRALWHYDETEDHYYIGKIWFNHADYERQIVSYAQAFHKDKIRWKNITDFVFNIQTVRS